MGSWGVKALESDAGLDVLDFLEEYCISKKEVILSEMITTLLEEGFFTEDRNDIDFYYDNSAVAVAEIILMFIDNGELVQVSFKGVEKLKTDKKSLEFILQYLLDIKNEKPDEDGEREYVELWKESDFYEDWKKHLESLICKINKEMK